MLRTTTRPVEIALPLASLAVLRRTIAEQIGADDAARMLQGAGQAAGDALFPLIENGGPVGTDGPIGSVPGSTFWHRLGELLANRGWGHLVHEPAHPGLGALETTDWAEADAAGSALRPSCHFTTGLLANLLGRVAGAEIGVLEVECRSRGDLRCRFLFGGAPALEAVYHRLADGEPLDSTLDALQ
jgi:hypothetical protein